MPNHIHHDTLIAFAKGATIEWRESEAYQWSNCENPGFLPQYQYRAKPTQVSKLVTIPEPCRVKPPIGTTYYLPDVTNGFYLDSWWQDDNVDNQRFNLGIVHLTAEAAIAHAEALLSISKP
jgi:hypothetical protein